MFFKFLIENDGQNPKLQDTFYARPGTGETIAPVDFNLEQKN